MSDLFISHSSENNPESARLVDFLAKNNHKSYFLDFDPEKGLIPGKRWEEELFAKLRNCQVVLVALTPNWIQSKWCFAEAVNARAMGKRVIFVKLIPCDASNVFPDVQHIDLTKNKADGYRKLLRGIGDVISIDRSRPPFPGMRSFDEKDSHSFFGRDEEILKGDELLRRLKTTYTSKFVLCLGASGSGKSSLVRAGLLPRLRRDQDSWYVLDPIRPQRNPLFELAKSIARAYVAQGGGEMRDTDRIFADLQIQDKICDSKTDNGDRKLFGNGLWQLLRGLRFYRRFPDATVLLPIDQAEELFSTRVI